MTATAHIRGNPIFMESEGQPWTWEDGTIAEPNDTSRPCTRCGRYPTPEGHDACLGRIPGATTACCGHGVTEGWVTIDADYWKEHYRGGVMNPLKEACDGLLMAMRVFVVIAVIIALVVGPLLLALKHDPAWGFLYFIEILWFCLPWHRRKGE